MRLKNKRLLFLSGSTNEFEWHNRDYNLQLPSHGLTWSKDDNSSEANKLFVCGVQPTERFDEHLLNSESQSEHLYLSGWSQSLHLLIKQANQFKLF